MAVATIAELTNELVVLLRTIPAIGERGFSVFNTSELESISGNVGFPLAGVSYEGAVKIEHSAQSKSPDNRSAALITLRFLVVIATPYRYADDVDEKPTMTNLLDLMRQTVLGYRGVNSRPWGYTGETPLETDIEGVIMYGQMWETDIPVVGISPI